MVCFALQMKMFLFFICDSLMYFSIFFYQIILKNFFFLFSAGDCPVQLPSLPTPPVSPKNTYNDVTENAKPGIAPEALKSQRTQSLCTKRKRDPIGQILDSLCNKADQMTSKVEQLTSKTPSAFSPIITSACSPQLSPLTMLANCERRCFQTSPNLITSSPYLSSPPSSMTPAGSISPPNLTAEQLQYIQAQRLAALHHQQIHQAHQQRTNQFLMHGGLPQDHRQLHILREHQAKLLIEQCHSGLSNQVPINKIPQNQTSPFWMAWFKSSAADSMPSFPPKESRVPQPPRYQCEDCKKSYSTFGGLSKHKQFHCVSHVKKEFNCKYCDKCYGSLGALKMHIRTHTLPCKCKLCGKAFSRPWLLQGHVRTHTGEKPFKCVHCGRAFADRSNLRAHLQTHSDIKKYGCKNCTKTFSRMSLLLKHEESSCLGLRRWFVSSDHLAPKKTDQL